MNFALTESKRTSLAPALMCTCFDRNLTTGYAYSRTPDTALAMDQRESLLGANASPNPSVDRQGTLRTTTPPPGHSACAAALTTAAVTHSVVLVKSKCYENYGYTDLLLLTSFCSLYYVIQLLGCTFQ
jgi:hypothetical protein